VTKGWVVFLTKGKIIPGKGFQYTPQTTIKWAEEFNGLLDSHSSRNELVSKLIEDGLKVQNGSLNKEHGIYIPLESFSHEQLILLRSEEGKRILHNVLSLILGNPSGSLFAGDFIDVAKQHASRSYNEQEVEQETEIPLSAMSVKSNSIGQSTNSKKNGDALSKLMRMSKLTDLR
jgi:hypothetical protein